MAKVFTIIVTYNGSRWIEKCLAHLYNSSMATNVVIVDNNSTDDTTKIIEEQFSGQSFMLFKTARNFGFGGGNNIGIEYALKAGADYIFLLNQDAYVEPGCIGKLVETLEKHKDYGILSPLQLDSSGEQPDPAFKKYMQASVAEEEIKKIIATRNCGIIPVRFVNAAAWMIPVPALRKTGVFHPAFAHYGEDNHYCSRMQYHGYKTGIDCEAAVIHDRGNETKDEKKNLLRQLRTVPLYTLLDIRKNFFLAWLLGYKKLKRIKKKLGTALTEDEKLLYREQKKWFRENLDRAKQIREETKKDAGI